VSANVCVCVCVCVRGDHATTPCMLCNVHRVNNYTTPLYHDPPRPMINQPRSFTPGRMYIAPSTRRIYRGMTTLLDSNKELMKLCERQRAFFRNMTVRRLTTIAGLASLDKDGSDFIGDHVLVIIKAFLDENGTYDTPPEEVPVPGLMDGSRFALTAERAVANRYALPP